MSNHLNKCVSLALCMTCCLIPAAHATESVPSDSLVAKSGIPASELERARAEGFDMSRMQGSPGLHIVSLDKSPFVGAMAGQIKQEIAEHSANGVVAAPASEVLDMRNARRLAKGHVDRFTMFDKAYASVADIRPHLRYEPISVSGTILDGLPLVEATAAGGLKDGRWSGLSRSWDVAGLGFVQLSESEYRESGGSITMVKEWVNAEVNGHAATIKTSRDDEGVTRVALGWVTDSTVFRLDLQPVDGDALKGNQEALLAMARALGS